MVINTINCINNHTSNSVVKPLTIIIILTNMKLGNKDPFINPT